MTTSKCLKFLFLALLVISLSGCDWFEDDDDDDHCEQYEECEGGYTCETADICYESKEACSSTGQCG